MRIWVAVSAVLVAGACSGQTTTEVVSISPGDSSSATIAFSPTTTTTTPTTAGADSELEFATTTWDALSGECLFVGGVAVDPLTTEPLDQSELSDECLESWQAVQSSTTIEGSSSVTSDPSDIDPEQPREAFTVPDHSMLGLVDASSILGPEWVLVSAEIDGAEAASDGPCGVKFPAFSETLDLEFRLEETGQEVLVAAWEEAPFSAAELVEIFTTASSCEDSPIDFSFGTVPAQLAEADAMLGSQSGGQVSFAYVAHGGRGVAIISETGGPDTELLVRRMMIGAHDRLQAEG